MSLNQLIADHKKPWLNGRVNSLKVDSSLDFSTEGDTDTYTYEILGYPANSVNVTFKNISDVTFVEIPSFSIPSFSSAVDISMHPTVPLKDKYLPTTYSSSLSVCSFANGTEICNIFLSPTNTIFISRVNNGSFGTGAFSLVNDHQLSYF